MKQITSENISGEIKLLLPRDIENVSRLAVVLLAEKKHGEVSSIKSLLWSFIFLNLVMSLFFLSLQYSGWATYVNSLPSVDEMHNAVCTFDS